MRRHTSKVSPTRKRGVRSKLSLARRANWKEGTMPHNPDLEAALDAARKAGRLILAAYESFVAIPDARADITTEVDRQSQETILQYLSQRFPADALCAEEATPTLAAASHSGSR